MINITTLNEFATCERQNGWTKNKYLFDGARSSDHPTYPLNFS